MPIFEIHLTRRDQAKLTPFQHARFDPGCGLVWIEDRATGLSHSPHICCEDNRVTRRLEPWSTWVPSHGFRYSKDISTITPQDKLAVLAQEYCQCSTCLGVRKPSAPRKLGRIVTTMQMYTHSKFRLVQ